jgi:uncharacterized protein YndB with AHSA1/START domain
MRSTVVIEIPRPRRQVAMLFADPANMAKWMRDLERYEHIGGENGAVGARYRMVFKTGRRQRAFVSTVTDMHLPERLSHRIESRNMDVLVKTTFTALAKDRTKIESRMNYIFHGMFRRLLSLFTQRAIRRRHHDDIQAFKRFAESSGMTGLEAGPSATISTPS